MQLDDIRLLLAYSDWAMERLLLAAASVKTPLPTRLLENMAHLIEAQRAWRMMLTLGAL